MSDLPAGWKLTTLENVCSQITDGTHKTPKYVDQGVPFISIANITPFKPIDWTSYVRFITREEHEELTKRVRPQRDDILITRIGTLGKAKIVDVDIEFSIFVGLGLIRPIKEIVEPRYLEAWMNSPAIRELSIEKATGSGRQTLALQETRILPIPLAPLDEQKRIVEKLDTLLTRVDSCERHLERVPQILKRFRQSVLAAATSGRLTEEWRKDENTISRDFGDFEFPDFPATWNLLPIKEIGQVKGGKRLPNGEKLVDYDTGFPYIRAGQLKKGTVISEDQLYLLPSTQKKISRYIVDAGDVYVTIVGASIGDAGIIPQNYNKVNLTENAAKICQLSGVDGNYLALWLRSPHAQDIIKSLIKSGAQGKLALSRINEIPVPLPSLEEQAEIVRRVESLFAVAERLEARYLSASEHVARLTPSLLAKGFRGELVGQGQR